jgi:sec-independent protein translocase protein TatA
MGRLGPTEILVIVAVIVILFGSKKIAGLGKSMGKSIREFKEEVNADGSTQSGSVSADAPTVAQAAPVQAETAAAPQTADHGTQQ